MKERRSAYVTLAQYRRNAIAFVAAAHPDWTITLGDAEDTFIFTTPALVEGQEGVGQLHNAYQQYRSGDSLEATYRMLLKGAESLEQRSLDRERMKDWSYARDLLMIQLARRYDERDQPPANRRVTLPWQGKLLLYPVIDFADTLAPVMAHDLRDWGVSAQTAADIGMARTRAALTTTMPDAIVVDDIPGVRLRIWDNDLPGYTATRALWPDLLFDRLPQKDTPEAGVVVAPDRDFCASLFVEDTSKRESFMAMAALAKMMHRRSDRSRQVMGPGMVKVGPGGRYKYDDNDDPEKARRELAEVLTLLARAQREGQA